MRGGRNKFGPMYKRDRARKLQLMRQRQIAVQTLRGSLGEGGLPLNYNNQPGSSPFASIHIKQEIQIPQVSSLTSSPDSSPSPIAVALGQVGTSSLAATSSSATNQQPALQIVGGGVGPGNGSGASNNATGSATGGGGGGGGGGGLILGGPDNKLWGAANSTTTSPHSLSPKAFQFDSVLPGGSTGTASAAAPVKVSPLIRDFVQAVDDREWLNSLYSLLQSQTYNQCEVDLFELMCKVLDQNLFSQVDWARNSIFFKDLKVNQ